MPVPEDAADLRSVWARSLEGLSDGSLPPQHRAWLTLTRPLALVEDMALLAAPNEFAKDVLETRLRPLITQALSRELGREIRVAVTVDPGAVEAQPQPPQISRDVLSGDRPGDDSPSAQLGPANHQSQQERPGQHPPWDQAPEQPPRHGQQPVQHPLGTDPGDQGTVPQAQQAPQSPQDREAPQFPQEAPQSFPQDFGAHAPQPVADDSPTHLYQPPHYQGFYQPPEQEHGQQDDQPPPAAQESSSEPVRLSTGVDGRDVAPGRSAEPAHLNPKYTFDTFVIGSSNRFAHAAAVAVAEAPAKAYNPLFVYGDSGLGKTHLLHAIGHYAPRLFGEARVRYVSSEEFTNDFINSIRDGKGDDFRRRYRDVDILLVDDIQFLENKEQTQEEFFHTFNTLHNANKQIIISSDRAPKQLVTLEDRLRNRFEWGLITDVQPPELETRIAILRKKAVQEGLNASPEVLEYIASKIQTNIRELEGALIRVTAFASLNRQSVDLQLAEIVLKDLIPDNADPEITTSTIMGETAAYFGLSLDDLCGTSRSRVLVTARQIAMYLCRELTDLSLPKIGQQFGGRDHTTVMHADRKIRKLMAERRSIYNQVTELTNRIKQQARDD